MHRRPIHRNVPMPAGYALTEHAWQRMSARSLPPAAVQAALRYGRIAHVRKAVIHAIGRKEVQRYRRHGIDLDRYEGVHVVCTPDGAIMTTYRNRSLRGLRPMLHHSHRRRCHV